MNEIDPSSIATDLAKLGHARLSLLHPAECRELAALYDHPDAFRSRVIMQRHGYGSGEYKYLSYPLPDLVALLRTKLYPSLAAIANDWAMQLGDSQKFPGTHQAYLEKCHAAGQVKPTPLLLRYVEGDYNCLHQDLYGELVFPLQLTVLLSEPGVDFTGGEFLLVEQRPRMQSRGEAIALAQGEAVIFPVRHRPVRGTRGVYRVTVRHGVSRVRSGIRQTLGIIFHDAA
jgi:hypothetical protein